MKLIFSSRRIKMEELDYKAFQKKKERKRKSREKEISKKNKEKNGKYRKGKDEYYDYNY
jgi:hypothetical protein